MAGSGVSGVPDTRICASCATARLSAYNKGVLCSSCEREASGAGYPAGAAGRDAVPVWVWGTAPVRRMLARLELGAAVEVFRLAAGLSRAQVGAAAGWSAAAIGYIETGTRDTIYDIRNLLRLLDALGVPREVLLPAILGHPGVFADRWAAVAETARVSSPAGQYRPGEIMHIIAGKLRARGWRSPSRCPATRSPS